MKLSENSDFSRKSSIQFYFIVVLQATKSSYFPG
jgi:hypothetical protein